MTTWCTFTVSGVQGVEASRLAVDSAGDLHIAYTTPGVLHYLKKTGPWWSFETVDQIPAGQSGQIWAPSLAVDRNNRPYVSYGRILVEPHQPALQGSLMYTRKAGRSWTVPEVVDPNMTAWGSRGDSSIALAIDSNVAPHISYISFNAPAYGTLTYVTKPGPGPWRPEPLISDPSIGQSTSIAVDSANTPHISYSSVSDVLPRQLKYATKEPGGWNHDTVAGDGGNTDWWNSIAVDGKRTPHIAYYNPATKKLEYAAKMPDGLWNRDTVADAGELYNAFSIAVDVSGFIHIGFHDVNTKRLRYATKTGTVWRTETVDQVQITGKATDVAVDAKRTPYVSYRSETKKALKLAEQVFAGIVVPSRPG